MTHAQMVPVTSSRVEAIGHENDCLFVRFRHGRGSRTYCYQNVSASLHTALLSADSIGRELQQTFVQRPDVHPFKQVTLEEGEATSDQPSA